MNLRSLNFIVRNDESRIANLVVGNYDVTTTLGIAKKLLSNGGNVHELTEKQRFHYESFIRPAIEGEECQTEDCGQIIDDDDTLLLCLEEDQFMCQHCRYFQEKMADED